MKIHAYTQGEKTLCGKNAKNVKWNPLSLVAGEITCKMCLKRMTVKNDTPPKPEPSLEGLLGDNVYGRPTKLLTEKVQRLDKAVRLLGKKIDQLIKQKSDEPR